MEALIPHITSWLATLTFGQIIVLLCVLMFLYSVYISVTSPRKYDERILIKSKYKKTLRTYIRDSLQAIHNTAVKGSREAIKDVNIECEQKCGLDPIHVQLNAYACRLDIILTHYLLDAIMVSLFNNGFAHLEGTALDTYCETKGGLLYDTITEKMYMYEDSYPDILASVIERIPRDYAIKIYKDIVHRYLDIISEEAKEVKALDKKYSVITKINFIAKLYNKLTGKDVE